jgi:hypothetical protein
VTTFRLYLRHVLIAIIRKGVNFYWQQCKDAQDTILTREQATFAWVLHGCWSDINGRLYWFCVDNAKHDKRYGPTIRAVKDAKSKQRISSGHKRTGRGRNSG